MNLSLDQTITKIREEQLSVWKLFILNAYKGNAPELFASFKEKDLARSIEYLQKQVEFCTELNECQFEIQAKTSENSNGPDATKTWSFKVPAKGNKNLNGNLNGIQQPTSQFNGFGAMEQIYLGQLQSIPLEKAKLEALKDDIRDQKMLLSIKENDLKREKENFDKFLSEKRKKLKSLRKKYTSDTGMAQEGFGKAFRHVIKELTGTDISGMNGAPAEVTPQTQEQKMIQSICSIIDDAGLPIEEIKAIGITVNLKIKSFKSGNGEENPKTTKTKKQTAAAE